MHNSTAERFQALNELLRSKGDGAPRLLIDLDMLDQNIESLHGLQSPGQLRLVVKSLPSAGLLTYMGERLWGVSKPLRLMVFHLPFLQQITAHFPDAEILMGKPLPINAMRLYYLWERHTCTGLNRAENQRNLQWLVDTPARLQQVIMLAEELGRRLSISLELDIGMHRGGVDKLRGLADLLQTIQAQRDKICLGGFMAYDAHAAKAPWPRSAKNSCEKSKARTREFLALARSDFEILEEEPWCINGAGSPTLALHADNSPLNDMSIGSALLKPANFDLPSTVGFEPAAWIATPVLKRLRGVRIPFLEVFASRHRDSLFIYGGRWMAVPAWPGSMKENKTYGFSSNQQIMTVDRNDGTQVDDYVFLRPQQSEAVLLQFGELLAIRGGEAVAEWAVLRNELANDRSGESSF